MDCCFVMVCVAVAKEADALAAIAATVVEWLVVVAFGHAVCIGAMGLAATGLKANVFDLQLS